MLNATYINWSSFLLRLATSAIEPIHEASGEDRRSALIVDDTMYERARSKKVELLANVFDHASKGKKYKRGFRLLTLGWSDGVTFVLLLYRHLSSENKKNQYNEAKPNLDKRSVGYKARLQAVCKAPAVLLSMLEQAKKAGVPARYVLFDSWFSFPSARRCNSALWEALGH